MATMHTKAQMPLWTAQPSGGFMSHTSAHEICGEAGPCAGMPLCISATTAVATGQLQK
jgi:hypothetical protein